MSGWSIAICRISARFFLTAGEAVVEMARGERFVHSRAARSRAASACELLDLIGSSACALIAMRRKLATDTPGIETGY